MAYRTLFLPSKNAKLGACDVIRSIAHTAHPLPLPFTLTLGIDLMTFVNHDIVVCVFPGQNSLGISAHKTLPLGLRTLAFGTEEIEVV